MSYVINGIEKEFDDYGYLLEPDFSEEAVNVIAAACGITLTDQHWKVVNYLRTKYKEDGHSGKADSALRRHVSIPFRDENDGLPRHSAWPAASPSVRLR